ncbi:MAG: hypothetical protein P0Y53_06990 [Candidatus Pseudobacter hemicellulosilyticus]|uniref:Uncharacterized protein n=1 Tax=Candidatus Pseudobacter hemicellulosilyticus TaxID=3121375 RepID=A0AAJ5WS74_9BACT|nr:MAG: hypothetical protein P0Y53_06990 [Pseudobacter sp.]
MTVIKIRKERAPVLQRRPQSGIIFDYQIDFMKAYTTFNRIAEVSRKKKKRKGSNKLATDTFKPSENYLVTPPHLADWPWPEKSAQKHDKPAGKKKKRKATRRLASTLRSR